MSGFQGLPPQSLDVWLAAIVESSDDAIISNTLDGVITTWNAAAERIFGYRPDEVIGRRMQLLFPESRQSEENMLMEQLRRGERVDHFETQRRAKDGRHIHISLTVSPIRNADGAVIGASRILRDISAQKLAEERIRNASEVKNRFLAILSHELRTPLTPVLAEINYLEKHAGLSNEVRGEIQRMKANLESEIHLIDDLLDLTRIDHGRINVQYEVTDLHTSLAQVVLMCREEIDAKQLEVTQELKANRHFVRGDPTRLRQVLWNLVKNAIKFTPPEGKIRITTANDPAGKLVMEFHDHGVGLTPEALGHIFDPFHQPDNKLRFGGLGLGLAISKSLAELHHGTLTASSEGQGKGSVFTLTLEPIEAAAAPAPKPPAASAVKSHRDVHILFVEDHEDTVAVIARLLRRCGYHVNWATSVREARQRLDTGQYDLLLSDIGLPDGSGWDVMKYARQKHLKGIAISGFGSPDDVQKSKDAGFALHLTKPIDFETLESEIEKVAC